MPKRPTSDAKSGGRFGKDDFVYLADQNAYHPAGETLSYRCTRFDEGSSIATEPTSAAPSYCRLNARPARSTASIALAADLKTAVAASGAARTKELIASATGLVISELIRLAAEARRKAILQSLSSPRL